MLVKLLAPSTVKTWVRIFLRYHFFNEKSHHSSFILPTVDHISEVSLQDILGKLPRPLLRGGTARYPRHFIFPVDSTAYDDALC